MMLEFFFFMGSRLTCILILIMEVIKINSIQQNVGLLFRREHHIAIGIGQLQESRPEVKCAFPDASSMPTAEHYFINHRLSISLDD